MRESVMTAEELRRLGMESGADLIGVAGIDRFDDVPSENHPSSIFPEARAVVVVAKRIVRGALRGVEEGTQFGGYRQYGYNWLEDRFLAMATFKTAEHLERDGWEAVPLLNLPTQIPAMGIPVREGQPAPNVLVDLEEAAVRAGLGVFGYPDVLVTPSFGPRQRVQAIITDAPLESDLLLAEDVCDRDAETLAGICPLGAIDKDRYKTRQICGLNMKVADIDFRYCRRCRNGAIPNRYHESGNPDRLAAACIRSYIDHLEKSGRLATQFRHPFRRRPTWSVKGQGLVYDPREEIDR